MKDGPIGVVPKDGAGTFSPFGKRPPEGPVGVRPKDGSTFSPFGTATVAVAIFFGPGFRGMYAGQTSEGSLSAVSTAILAIKLSSLISTLYTRSTQHTVFHISQISHVQAEIVLKVECSANLFLKRIFLHEITMKLC